MYTNLVRKQLIFKEEIELDKAILFIRMGIKNLDMKIPKESVDKFLEKLQQQAIGMRMGIEISIRDHETERTIAFGLMGAAAGAIIGAQIAGVPGAIAGTAAGALAGCIAARINIHIDLCSCKQQAIISLVA